MRRNASTTKGALTALLAGAAILCWSTASFAATPLLGPDCGTGASIVGGDAAGKVTLGAGVSTCTLEFSVPPLNPPACTATNETNGGGHAVGVGVRTTTTTLQMDGMYPWSPGDVVSYACLSF